MSDFDKFDLSGVPEDFRVEMKHILDISNASNRYYEMLSKLPEQLNSDGTSSKLVTIEDASTLQKLKDDLNRIEKES